MGNKRTLILRATNYHASTTSSLGHYAGGLEVASLDLSLDLFCFSGRERPKMGKKASTMLNYLRGQTKSDCSQQCLDFSFGSKSKL